MVSIRYSGSSLVMIDALFKTNLLLEEDAFYQAISSHGRFDMANIDAPAIAQLLKESTLRMTVDTYIRPWSKADTYDDPDEPTLIYINQWRINRSIPGFCNAFVHKIVHAVNAENPQYEFGHGDNSPIGKENTAPYWIGSLAERMIIGAKKLTPSKLYTEIT
jgi:hypothetical protein